MWGACQYHLGFSVADALGNKMADMYESGTKQLLKATAKVAFELGFTMAMAFKGSDAFMKAEIGLREMSVLGADEISVVYKKVADAAWSTIETKFDF